MKYLYDRRKKWLGNALLLISLAVVVLTPAVYNDFYYTLYYHAYRLVKGVEVENLNYREFFSEELFDEIKEDIGYDGEYGIAYGMHPAVLSYNGISTLDGYLGFYPQEYKEKFGAMIAPATRTGTGMGYLFLGLGSQSLYLLRLRPRTPGIRCAPCGWRTMRSILTQICSGSLAENICFPGSRSGMRRSLGSR